MDELMKALCYPAKGEIELVERDVPTPGPGEALVKVAASGICHTDIDVLHARYGPGAFPVVPGHEFSGIVHAVHEASLEGSTIRPGDRVVVDPNLSCGQCRSCRRGLANLCETLGAYGVTRDGGFAEYAVVSVDKLLPIGALDFAVAALAEPLACILNGLRQAAGTAPVDRALIYGAGPIGLLMALALQLRSVPDVAVVDLDENRLSIAADLAVRGYQANSKELNDDNRSFDLVIEATGQSQVLPLAFESVADGGAVLVFGVADPTATVDLSPYQIFRRQLTLVGSHSLNGNIAEALDLLRSAPDRFAKVATESVPLTDIAPFLHGEEKGKMKVQFRAFQ